MNLSSTPGRALIAAVFASLMVLSFIGTAAARPVAEFTTSVVSPHVARTHGFSIMTHVIAVRE